MKKKSKRGLELMANTAVIIIMAILVGVVLLIFWDIETGKFSTYLNDLMGKTNVDNIVVTCNSFVARNSAYEYCCSNKTVRYERDNIIKEEEMTCYKLSGLGMGARVEKMECENVCG